MDTLPFATQRLPREAPPRIGLGQLCLRAGELSSAIEVLEQAATVASQERHATGNLMIAPRRAGRRAEAAAMAVRMREQLGAPQHAEVRWIRYKTVSLPGSWLARAAGLRRCPAAACLPGGHAAMLQPGFVSPCLDCSLGCWLAFSAFRGARVGALGTFTGSESIDSGLIGDCIAVS